MREPQGLFGQLPALARRCLRWLDSKWMLSEVHRRRDYTGPDLPRLIIIERENRP